MTIKFIFRILDIQAFQMLLRQSRAKLFRASYPITYRTIILAGSNGGASDLASHLRVYPFTYVWVRIQDFKPKLKCILYTTFLVSVIIFYSAYSVFADEDRLDLRLAWRDGDALPAGAFSTVNVTVTNRFVDPVALGFVGVRFDWMDEGIYLYGGGSEEPHQLFSEESIIFSIAFDVPKDAEAGPHRVYIALVYLVNGEEFREVIQVEPPFNVIDIVTVTFTETVLTTLYGEPSGEAPHPSRPLWVTAAVAGAGGLAFFLFLVYRRAGRKG